jgi:hypothetical protein
MSKGISFCLNCKIKFSWRRANSQDSAKFCCRNCKNSFGRIEKACKVCGKIFNRIKASEGTFEYCSRQCSNKDNSRIKNTFCWDTSDDESKKAKIIQNFYGSITIKNGCWEFRSELNKQTYPSLEVGKRKIRNIHRISYEIHKGEIPKGMVVRHLCHNSRCCRPSHLEIGTQKQNIQDSVVEDRQAKGSKNGNSKLQENHVIEIKKMMKLGFSNLEISEKFNVSSVQINNIRRGKQWKHVPWPT